MESFVTINSDSSEGRRTTNMDAEMLYVAAVVPGMRSTLVDEDDIECEERDANRDVISDLYVPLFCCRSPHRTLPPRTPEQALRDAAAKGREGLRPGMVVLLNGQEILL